MNESGSERVLNSLLSPVRGLIAKEMESKARLNASLNIQRKEVTDLQIVNGINYVLTPSVQDYTRRFWSRLNPVSTWLSTLRGWMNWWARHVK